MPTTIKRPDRMPTFGWHFVRLAFCPHTSLIYLIINISHSFYLLTQWEEEDKEKIEWKVRKKWKKVMTRDSNVFGEEQNIFSNFINKIIDNKRHIVTVLCSGLICAIIADGKTILSSQYSGSGTLHKWLMKNITFNERSASTVSSVPKQSCDVQHRQHNKRDLRETTISFFLFE